MNTREAKALAVGSIAIIVAVFFAIGLIVSYWPTSGIAIGLVLGIPIAIAIGAILTNQR